MSSFFINISAKPPVPGYPLHRVPHSRRKTAIATQIEIIHFIEHYGINHSAMLTLCFPSGTRLKEAQLIYNNAARRFLKELFPAWLTVVEFHSHDRPHFHLIVATRQDHRTGFNFAAYDAMKAITKRSWDEHRPLTKDEKIERGQHAHNLTNDPALKAIWKQLRKQLPHFGFSKSRPAELIPLRKNGEAVAFYLTKQFLEKHLCEFIPSKARLLRSSADYPRVIPRIGNLIIDTPGRRRCLERRVHILEVLGCADVDAMKMHFGKSWTWRCHQVDRALVDRYGWSIPWNDPAVAALAEQVMADGYVRPDPWKSLFGHLS